MAKKTSLKKEKNVPWWLHIIGFFGWLFGFLIISIALILIFEVYFNISIELTYFENFGYNILYFVFLILGLKNGNKEYILYLKENKNKYVGYLVGNLVYLVSLFFVRAISVILYY